MNFQSIYTTIKQQVKNLLTEANICPSHGYNHAIAVVRHGKKASKHLSPNIHFLIKLACLLHDIDDTKFFPQNKNYENARLVMKNLELSDVDLVIEMISYVSSSKNGDSIPTRALEFPWLLYPRYADRLEAIGLIGIARCYKYAKTSKSPLFIDSTLKATSEFDLWERIATSERYASYKGASQSFIDHFYDKLLRLSKFNTNNEYFETVKTEREKVMVAVVMNFAETNSVDTKNLDILIQTIL